MTRPCPVVHFEMPYGDDARMARFYEAAFGWRMQPLGAAMGHYVLAITTESGPAGPTVPGTINGGFFPKAEMADGALPSVVIAVDDLDAKMAAVTDAGGSVESAAMDIPGVGRYALIRDSEGNRVGMLQPLPRSAEGG